MLLIQLKTDLFFSPGTRKGTALSAAKNLFSVFLHLFIKMFGKTLGFLGGRQSFDAFLAQLKAESI